MELADQPRVDVRAKTIAEGDGSIAPIVWLDGGVLEWSADRRLRLTWARGRPFFDLGLVPADLVGMRVTEAFGRIDSEITPVVAHLRALDGESVCCRIRWGTRILEAKMSPRRNAEGYVIGVVARALDLTEDDRTRLREGTGPAALQPPRRGRTHAAAVRTP